MFSYYKYPLSLFLLVTSNYQSSSQNLLANGSFEDENTCTEFHEKCSPSGWINISLNSSVVINSYALDGSPEDGSHFVKVVASNNKVKNSNSFISTKMLCSFRKGNKYIIEFYYRTSSDAIDSLGILFSSHDFLYESKTSIQLRPNIWIEKFDSTIGEKYNKWVKRKYIFIAQGEENYIAFGVFRKSEYTFVDNNNFEEEQYVYLDNVSMIPNDPNERACESIDSNRFALYRKHDRHALLLKSRLALINKPPPVIRAAKTVLRYVDSLLLTDINFETGNSNISSKKTFILDSLLEILVGKKIDSILIEGHTDSVGEFKKNEALSTQRALAVSEYLSNKLNILSEKVRIISYADKRPIDSNGTLAGRQRNRRVEIYVYSNHND